jgi:soluble lytic murein transglycosylase-like protein
MIPLKAPSSAADLINMVWWIALTLLTAPAKKDPAPQTPAAMEQPTQEQRVRAAMEASLAKQRASVQVQAKTAGAPSVPWSDSATPTATTAPCDPMPRAEIDRLIAEVASAQKIDASIVREVAREESGFRPCAVSPKGAAGMMQLMPATQASLQVGDPFNARASLEGGSKLLKQLLDRYHGDLKLALSAYNAGSGRVDQAGGVPAIAETRKYVAEILARLASRLP